MRRATRVAVPDAPARSRHRGPAGHRRGCRYWIGRPATGAGGLNPLPSQRQVIQRRSKRGFGVPPSPDLTSCMEAEEEFATAATDRRSFAIDHDSNKHIWNARARANSCLRAYFANKRPAGQARSRGSARGRACRRRRGAQVRRAGRGSPPGLIVKSRQCGRCLV